MVTAVGRGRLTGEHVVSAGGSSGSGSGLPFVPPSLRVAVGRSLRRCGMDVFEELAAKTLPSGMVVQMRPAPALSCPVCPAGMPLVILGVGRVAEDETSDPQAG